MNPGPPVFHMSVPLGENIPNVSCGRSLDGPDPAPVQLQPSGRSSRDWTAAAAVPRRENSWSKKIVEVVSVMYFERPVLYVICGFTGAVSDHRGYYF